MTRALILLLLGSAALAFADGSASGPLGYGSAADMGSGQEEVPKTKWKVELTEHHVPADGHHIGLKWTRDFNPMGTIVIFRRQVPQGTTGEGKPILVVDRLAQIVPAFMYPDTFRDKYYPAFDASQTPIPRGTKLGVWTVADSVDGDRELWIDEVPDSEALYEYTFAPAKRGAAPDTYTTLMGNSVVTPPLAPRPAAWFRHLWVQIAALVVLGVFVVLSFVMRRRRAGAKPPAEAS